MQFELTEQQRMIKDLAADFAAREVAPIAAQIDQEERFPTDVVKKMGELGFMGMNVSEKYGEKRSAPELRTLPISGWVPDTGMRPLAKSTPSLSRRRCPSVFINRGGRNRFRSRGFVHSRAK